MYYKTPGREKQSFFPIPIDNPPPLFYDGDIPKIDTAGLRPPAGKGKADMSVILGIDIGGSTTKSVGLRPDGGMISMLRVRARIR